jgi:hypothetical protein
MVLYGSSIVEVYEERSGLHGATYHFIREGKELVHVSRHALWVKHEPRANYYIIDLDELKGKEVVEFLSSRSGPIGFYSYPAEYLGAPYNMRENFERKLSYEDVLNRYELEHLTLAEKAFLTEWVSVYTPMLESVRRFIDRRDVKVRGPELFWTHLKYKLRIPLPFVIPYSEKSRAKSLEVLTKEIHQIWIALKILDKLGFKPIRQLKGKPWLEFRQSPSSATAIVRGYGLWYEFDMNPHTMCEGMLWYLRDMPPTLKAFYERLRKLYGEGSLGFWRDRRIALRPDLVFINAKNCDEIAQGLFDVKLIIECKNQEFYYWRQDVKGQIIPYKCIFEPERMLIVSLKPVPQRVKALLSEQGIDIVDDVCPGGRGKERFVEYVREAL